MHPRAQRSVAARDGHWEWTLPHEEVSVGGARRLVAAAISEVDRAVVEVALLLTSEVVTNTLRYGAGDTLHLTLDVSRARLRVQVEDHASSPRELPIPAQLDDRGLGLMLLDALSTGWGSSSTPTGKVVWFSLALTAAPAEPEWRPRQDSNLRPPD